MSTPSSVPDLKKLLAERDVLLRLLELYQRPESVRETMGQALRLIVASAGAARGYLELRSHDDDADAPPRWWIADGLSEIEIELARGAISTGIVARAIATGETIVTQSALTDARFLGHESVRENQIRAVLCAPIGDPIPHGVLYLQGANDGGSFDHADRSLTELFCRHFGPLAERVVANAARTPRTDPTQPYRDRLNVESLVGRSPAFARVLAGLSVAAPVDVMVLITGPTGSGKTQLARAIHDNSGRRNGPFLAVNCAAIPDDLIESELFGAKAGAHSTATRDLPGRIAAADGGTLFLDEIGELSARAQAKLLQFLDAGTYNPLGANIAKKADVRLIAATNVDLEEACNRGNFRSDLLYRLRVLTIRMPSLRERAQDIPDLALAFCTEICARHGFAPLLLTPGAITALQNADWPGNARELRSAVERAAIWASGQGATRIDSQLLLSPTEEPEEHDETPMTWERATRQFQRQYLTDILADTAWNVSAAARRLDVTRAHVYNLIQAFGLHRKTTPAP